MKTQKFGLKKNLTFLHVKQSVKISYFCEGMGNLTLDKNMLSVC